MLVSLHSSIQAWPRELHSWHLPILLHFSQKNPVDGARCMSASPGRSTTTSKSNSTSNSSNSSSHPQSLPRTKLAPPPLGLGRQRSPAPLPPQLPSLPRATSCGRPTTTYTRRSQGRTTSAPSHQHYWEQLELVIQGHPSKHPLMAISSPMALVT